MYHQALFPSFLLISACNKKIICLIDFSIVHLISKPQYIVEELFSFSWLNSTLLIHMGKKWQRKGAHHINYKIVWNCIQEGKRYHIFIPEICLILHRKPIIRWWLRSISPVSKRNNDLGNFGAKPENLHKGSVARAEED